MNVLFITAKYFDRNGMSSVQKFLKMHEEIEYNCAVFTEISVVAVY